MTRWLSTLLSRRIQKLLRSLSVPVKTQGSHVSFDGFSVDLDTGAVTAAERATSTALTTNTPAALCCR